MTKKRKLILAGVVLALLMLAIISPGKPEPTEPVGQPFTTDTYNNEDPSIIKVGQTYYVAWISDQNDNVDIWLKSGDGQTWSEPIKIIASPHKDLFPTLAYDGTFHLSFFRIDNNTTNADVWYASSKDGIKWTEERITNSNSIDWVPRITIHQGTRYLIWPSKKINQKTGKNIMLSKNSGLGWTNPIEIINSPQEDDFPHFTVIDNKFYLTWSQFNVGESLFGGPSAKIMLSYSSNATNWSSPEIVSDENRKVVDIFPYIYTGKGGSYIIWTSVDTKGKGGIIRRALTGGEFDYLAKNKAAGYSSVATADIMLWVKEKPSDRTMHDIYFTTLD